MNCRPGDLAVVVESMAGNEGRIVTCLRLATAAEVDAANLAPDRAPYWHIDTEILTVWGSARLAADMQLRPIRDQDGEDEILQLVGKPEGVTA